MSPPLSCSAGSSCCAAQAAAWAAARAWLVAPVAAATPLPLRLRPQLQLLLRLSAARMGGREANRRRLLLAEGSSARMCRQAAAALFCEDVPLDVWGTLSRMTALLLLLPPPLRPGGVCLSLFVLARSYQATCVPSFCPGSSVTQACRVADLPLPPSAGRLPALLPAAAHFAFYRCSSIPPSTSLPLCHRPPSSASPSCWPLPHARPPLLPPSSLRAGPRSWRATSPTCRRPCPPAVSSHAPWPAQSLSCSCPCLASTSTAAALSHFPLKRLPAVASPSPCRAGHASGRLAVDQHR